MKTKATVLKPISENERIDFLDVLRGIAIFGIFLANLQWFSFSFLHLDGKYIFPSVDYKLSFIYAFFIDGKFYTIFSILFGWGLALQLKRTINKPISGKIFLIRRLLYMMLLGAIHLLLIWEGDIILFYGITGFFVIAMRNLSTKTQHGFLHG